MNERQQYIVDRFIRYARFDTRSDELSTTPPTTKKQEVFTLKLAEELEDSGFSEIEYNPENGYLTATIPANVEEKTLTVGFVAHVDTVDYQGTVNPQIHEDYDGGIVVLDKLRNIIMDPAVFPNLLDYVGETLITTDGTAILGADDKSGIAAMITMGEYFLSHPEVKHGRIRFAFGPDEEIGARGAKKFDTKAFGAHFGYTVDSGARGNLTYDNFNAGQFNVTIRGRSVHPGATKVSMINALHVGAKLASRLPQDQLPETTSGREGYYALMKQWGDIDTLHQNYYIRDHDISNFSRRLQFMSAWIEELNGTYGADCITYDFEDQYRNMKDIVERYPFVLDIARSAYKKNGIVPRSQPMRGGTDGAVIAQMGIPMPDIFSGSENSHGRYEFVSARCMEQIVDVLVDIVQETAERSADISDYPKPEEL